MSENVVCEKVNVQGKIIVLSKVNEQQGLNGNASAGGNILPTLSASKRLFIFKDQFQFKMIAAI